MSTINKVILTGYVGKDPEVTVTEKGTVASMSLATNEFYKDSSGERKKITDWHRVVAWKGGADLIKKYVRKGSLVGVIGALKTRAFTDKQGNKRSITEVRMDELIFFPKAGQDSHVDTTTQETEAPKKKSTQPKEKASDNLVEVPSQDDEDELPF